MLPWQWIDKKHGMKALLNPEYQLMPLVNAGKEEVQ